MQLLKKKQTSSLNNTNKGWHVWKPTNQPNKQANVSVDFNEPRLKKNLSLPLSLYLFMFIYIFVTLHIYLCH